MGNKIGKRRKAIEYKPNVITETKAVSKLESKKKEQNAIARNILQDHVADVPNDDEIKLALALQQSAKTGALTKLDYIAILVRLNPQRNNALMSQYKIKDLIALIRYELYTKHLPQKVEEIPNKIVVL